MSDFHCGSRPGSLSIPLRIAGVLALLCPFLGCSLPPDLVPWRAEQPVVHPQVPTGQEAPVRGRLVVETAETGNPEEGRIPHAAYYVFHPDGRFLDRFPNEYLVPISLPPGRYVVVSRLPGAFRRVQVEILDHQTTFVSLKDFQQAPVTE